MFTMILKMGNTEKGFSMTSSPGVTLTKHESFLSEMCLYHFSPISRLEVIWKDSHVCKEAVCASIITSPNHSSYRCPYCVDTPATTRWTGDHVGQLVYFCQPSLLSVKHQSEARSRSFVQIVMASLSHLFTEACYHQTDGQKCILVDVSLGENVLFSTQSLDGSSAHQSQVLRGEGHPYRQKSTRRRLPCTWIIARKATRSSN